MNHFIALHCCCFYSSFCQRWTLQSWTMGPTWLASLEWMELGLVQLTLQWKRWDIELLSKYAAGQTWAKGFLNIVSFNVHWPKNHVRQRQQCFSKWTQRRLAIYRRCASCTDINKSDFFTHFQPGGSLFNIEHSNQGLITFPGGVPLVTKGFYLNILSFNITKVPFSSL